MKLGFGSPGGNYWRGLDDISTMSMTGTFKLDVYLTTSDSNTQYGMEYSTFSVGSESTGYLLTIDGFGGNFTVDGFSGYTGYTFTATDKTNGPAGGNCAVTTGGSWWYGTDCQCGACLTQPGAGFVWQLGFTPYTLVNARMYLVCK